MGFDEWQEVSRRGYKKGSKHDDVTRISTSVFVTNFPTSFTAKELYLTWIPLNAWSSNTFSRIGNKWGEVMDIEESTESLLSRKRLCIKTCLPINILESFKVIFKGKFFMVRAKELFTWSPCFFDFKVDDYSSDEEPQVGDLRKLAMPMDDMEKVVNDSDEEVVSESFFETGHDLNCINNEGDGIIQEEVQNSVDPFGIYDILNKNTVKNAVPDPSLSHPPGFTPVQSSSDSPLVERTRVREISPVKQNGDTRVDDSNVNTRGSMLDVLDDLIKVGKSMGYVMEGCSKDFKHIISSQGVGEGFK
nr:RNA-directed DNA polymerase, eukaryota [Tanacetum cinerariifolium]